MSNLDAAYRMGWLWSALVIGVLLATGCSHDGTLGQVSCETSDDCGESNTECISGYCVVAEVEADAGQDAGSDADQDADARCEPEDDDSFCARHGAECGQFSGSDNCGDLRDADCGGCPDREQCGEASANRCGCPCEIDEMCFGDGEANPDNACQVCDSEQSEEQFTSAVDGTACDDGDECTQASCQGGDCQSSPICFGTDTSCGCSECTDCTESDDWYDIGDPYACCDGDEACQTCQDQEFRTYFCDGDQCDYVVLGASSTQTVTSDCTECEGDEFCAEGGDGITAQCQE